MERLRCSSGDPNISAGRLKDVVLEEMELFILFFEVHAGGPDNKASRDAAHLKRSVYAAWNYGYEMSGS